MVLVAVDVRRPGSPITGLKHFTFRIGPVRYGCQKAWKPDYGIETSWGVRSRVGFSMVRRPGSPITGLKLLLLLRLGLRLIRQKAWKPDYGIETPTVGCLKALDAAAGQKAWKPDYGIETAQDHLAGHRGTIASEGLEARL